MRSPSREESFQTSSSQTSFFEPVPLTGIYICDPSGLITYYNHHAAELWGREPRLGDPDLKFCGSLHLYWPDGSPLPHDQTPMAAVLKSGVPVRDQEVVIEKPDGSTLLVNVNIDPLIDGHGEIAGAINVFQDISDRKALWVESQRQRGLLETFFEIDPGGLAVLAGEELTFELANPAFRCFMPDPERDPTGRPFSQVWPENETFQGERILREVLHTGLPFDSDRCAIAYPDGSTRYFSLHLRCIEQHGQPAVAITCWEITGLEEAKRQAEKAVEVAAQMEERFSKAFFASPVAMVISKLADGEIIEINDSFEKFFSLTREETLGKTSTELNLFYDPADREALLERFTEEGYLRDFEFKVRDSQGNPRFALLSTESIVLDGEKSLLTNILDINERKQAEDALRWERELLQKLFDRIPVMISIFRPDIQVMQLNKAFEQVTGWTIDEALQGGVMEIVYPNPDYRAWVRAYMESLQEGWRDIVMIGKDGSEIETSWANIRLSDDTHVGIGLDLRDRKRAERALQESERLLRAVLDHLPVGVRFHNANGEIIFGNPAIRTIWGMPQGIELESAWFRKGWWPDSGEKISQQEWAVDRAITSGEKVLNEVIEIESLDGTRKTIRNSAVPVLDEEGLVSGAVVLKEDITELKRVEEELRRLNMELEERVKERTQELAELQRGLVDSVESERLDIARELHDGPMQEIYALSYAVSGLGDDLPREQFEIEMKDLRTHLLQINEALRSITRDLRPPELSPYGLERSIREHIETIHKFYPEMKISLDLISDGQTLPEEVRLALFRIYQVAITNIVRHARATEVNVTFFFDDQQIVLDIQDNGSGFNPPARWVTLARRGHLGLIGAVERAKAIGGELQLQSKPGQGTRIRVIIPRNDG
jgi:PAS domain S-box-containing protein